MNRFAPFCAALSAALLFASPASALIVEGQNFGSDVSAEVLLSWDGVDTLTITIENTSNAAAIIESSITGFAMNLPDGITGVSALSVSGTQNDPGWAVLDANPNGGPGNAPGGYLFDFGIGTGSNIAGGFPNDGVGIGDTATFIITFTGDTAGLTEADFLSETTDGDGGPSNFLVRFQAIPTGAGSDAAVAVPAPGVALLLLSSLPLWMRRRH